ncbi:hypothetical protein KIW84_011268 [Lathyrus oleraceus]|nr:hypothetical protein KIW84_011268 [Pisum sativum]
MNHNFAAAKEKANMSLMKLSTRNSISSSLRIFQTSRFLSYVADDERVYASSSIIHPTATVHPNAILGQGVSIGPFCSISSSAKLGNGCRLYPGSHVFGNTELGDSCTLMT